MFPDVFINMAGDLNEFLCHLLSLFFLVNMSKHPTTKGSTFYSWVVKHGAKKWIDYAWNINIFH